MGLSVIAWSAVVGMASALGLALLDRAIRQRHDPPTTESRHQFTKATGRLFSLVLLVLAAVTLGCAITQHLDPSPRGNCGDRITRQSLADLTEVPPGTASKKLKSWLECDAGYKADVQHAVERDARLIVLIGVSMVAATFVTRTSRRWRAAANVGAFFAAMYVFAARWVDALLQRRLHHQPFDPYLESWAAVKYGAGLATVPFFLLALAVTLSAAFMPGEATQKATNDSKDAAGASKNPPTTEEVGFFDPVWRFGWWLDRNLRRVPLGGWLADRLHRPLQRNKAYSSAPSDTVREDDVKAYDGRIQPGSDDKLGINCSGGGIRSASFCLGALQSLDQPPRPGDDDDQTRSKAERSKAERAGPDRSEVERADLLSAVSGGSYLASAWVTARWALGAKGAEQPTAWSRGSPEEAYLRRHANYLAPGFGGKLWAVTRFLFGFATNITLIVAALLAVAVPAGWMISRSVEGDHLDAGTTITLPRGGCVQEGRQKAVRLAPKTTLLLIPNQVPVIDTDVRSIPPASNGDEVSVSATIKDGDETEASGDLSAPGTVVVGSEDGPRATLEIPDPEQPAKSAGSPVESCTNRPADQTVKIPAHLLTASDTYPAGTILALRQPDGLQVEGENLAACGNGDEACTEEEWKEVDLKAETFLSYAPDAQVKLAQKGALSRGSRVLKACGDDVCKRLDPVDLLGVTLAAFAGLLIALGVTIVLTIRPPVGAAQLERLVRLLTITWTGLFVILWIYPRIVVATANERAVLEGGFTSVTGFGALAYLAAITVQVTPLIRPLTKPPEESAAPVQLLRRFASWARPLFVKFVGAIVGPLLLIAIVVIAASTPIHSEGPTPKQALIWLAALGPLALILLGGDLNGWSLHTFYRSRLQSAFAMDRRHLTDDPAGASPGRPLPREDPLWDLPPNGPKDDQGLPVGTRGWPHQPTLVVCAAVNLADDRVTAPGRPVGSWTFSPERVGSACLGPTTKGYVHPESLASDHLSSAWTAVAVSGAAFSPAMGKMSRPERSVLAIANLRLGVWYPNPRHLNEIPAWYGAHRMARPWYLAKEILGLHRADDRWVYLTDGGHYENLGLIELLRSGCREIYCLDASGDKTDTFGTFSDAARLARAELEVEIHLDVTPLTPDESGLAPTGVTAGWFEVPALDDEPPQIGWIVLAKLVIPQDAPKDIVDLARTVPGFPTNSTADQLFTDQKFEAYRALGEFLGHKAAAAGRDLRAGDTATAAGAAATVKAVNEILVPPAGDPDPSQVELSGSVTLAPPPAP